MIMSMSMMILTIACCRHVLEENICTNMFPSIDDFSQATLRAQTSKFALQCRGEPCLLPSNLSIACQLCRTAYDKESISQHSPSIVLAGKVKRYICTHFLTCLLCRVIPTCLYHPNLFINRRNSHSSVTNSKRMRITFVTQQKLTTFSRHTIAISDKLSPISKFSSSSRKWIFANNF